MLIYMEFLCALVVIAYLIQFLLYSHSRYNAPGTDILDITRLPIKSELKLGIEA